MATKKRDTFRPFTDDQLRAGTNEYGQLTDEALETLDTLKCTYSRRTRFLRPEFVLDEATEILEDISAIDDADRKRVSYARLEARGIQYGPEVNGVIKVWASREISGRRRWISTLKLWRWLITLIAPIPAIAAANYLGRWAIDTFLSSP